MRSNCRCVSIFTQSEVGSTNSKWFKGVRFINSHSTLPAHPFPFIRLLKILPERKMKCANQNRRHYIVALACFRRKSSHSRGDRVILISMTMAWNFVFQKRPLDRVPDDVYQWNSLRNTNEMWGARQVCLVSFFNEISLPLFSSISFVELDRLFFVSGT